MSICRGKGSKHAIYVYEMNTSYKNIPVSTAKNEPTVSQYDHQVVIIITLDSWLRLTLCKPMG